MTNDEYTKSILATLCWREDRSDALQGMVACGLVVRNRVKAGFYGGDWIQVMCAHNQYSSMSVVGDSQSIIYGDLRDPPAPKMRRKLMQKVETIYAGTEPDITDGSLYYGNLVNVTSGWFKTEILGKLAQHPRVATIGRQTFLR